MLFPFQGKFEKLLNFFSVIYIFSFCWFDLFQSGLFMSKIIDSIIFFVKIYHSCVIFSDLKCSTCVFREAIYGCLCSCSGIAKN